MGHVRMADRAAELALVRTNVEAVVDLCALFVPGMATRHRGAVMNTASTASFQPLPGQASYGASKAFVLSYGRALAAELRGSGVTVTTLCPGPVETGFAEAAGMTDEEAAESLPKIMWLPADEVARAGVEGLAAGRTVVIPGDGQPRRCRAGPSGAEVDPRPAPGQAPPGAQGGLNCRRPSTEQLSRRRPESVGTPQVGPLRVHATVVARSGTGHRRTAGGPWGRPTAAPDDG